MPEYRTGTCDFCGNESDKLLLETAVDESGVHIAWACPECRRALDWIRGERGEREAHQEEEKE